MTSSSYLYSIDPGVNGAICRWDEPSGMMQLYDINLDDIPALADFLTSGNIDATIAYSCNATVVLETTHARPITGSKGNFQQGETRGILRAVCAMLGHTIVEVRPQEWKLDMGLIGADKNASRERAAHLYPGLAPQLQRVKDHDRAEAILIGHWFKYKREVAA